MSLLSEASNTELLLHMMLGLVCGGGFIAIGGALLFYSGVCLFSLK